MRSSPIFSEDVTEMLRNYARKTAEFELEAVQKRANLAELEKC